MIDKSTTEELLSILNHTENKTDLESYVLNIEHNISFSDFINTIIEEKKFKKSDIIRLSNIQRNYAYQILNGEKQPGRDKVIALCLSMDFNLKDTQKALTISNNSILYSKIKRDSIIIFCINKGFSFLETNELLFEMNENIIE